VIIQFVLVGGLLLCLVYALLRRRKSLPVSVTIFFTSVAGIYFVLFPGETTEIAQRLGVGRGADLVLYCWIVISLAVSMNLRFRLLDLQQQVTELARELALRAPRRPDGAIANDAGMPEPAPPELTHTVTRRRPSEQADGPA
jgi:small membrane protein